MNTKLLFCTVITCSMLVSTAALARNTPIQDVQKKWAECQYNTFDSDEKEQCFHRAIAKTSIYLDREPGSPELTIWLAINKASLAGAQGGLGALSLAKEAKSLLESVIASSPRALDGSAYTSLGSLYYKVPGWPLAFGDDEKAEEMLKKALEINPKGIDPNYFYGDFLIEEGRDKEAKVYLTRAKQASPRPDRPIADKGRKMEIEATLGRLK
ncbi:tetratricopeptide repeat protein [Vibrio sp. ES.051]|uniref:tetratricopeptide repeat protein n=1 Tax=Vibrio sp. ES.051 TaxID=1761909 RepID=UPI000BFA9D54|nr:tetratricopeptide repeat protein [Vibrio sp. ES.051]PFG56243.1 tetratricopeptide repeat protein [Vibrio sp. ES.051]